MTVTDELQTIPTHTDMLYIYSTVEGTRSPLAQAGSCSPTSPTTPDPAALLQDPPSSRPSCTTPPTPPLKPTALQSPEPTALRSPGYLSYRHDRKGSGFIQTLVDVFLERKEPILELLTEVSWDSM